MHNGALCTRKRNGKKFVYRMCDHPETDGLEVPEEAGKMEGLVLSAIVGFVASRNNKILKLLINFERVSEIIILNSGTRSCTGTSILNSKNLKRVCWGKTRSL